MTRQPAGSFLLRLERADDGASAGTVTSVQTGEHADFDGFAELQRILEGWSEGSGRSQEP